MIRWRLMCFVFALLGPVRSNLTGQTPTLDKRQFDEQIHTALTAPSELGADLLLSIARQAGQSRRDRVELLIRAFHLAGSSKYPFRRVPAVSGAYNTDSDAGVVSSALAPGLDRLSLQSRAIRELAEVDGVSARRLFESLSTTVIPSKLTCEDSLGYSFDEYYSTALALMYRAYSQRERDKGEHVQLAGGLLRQVSSPFQLHGALKLLSDDRWSTEELRTLTALFSSALSEISSDDRSFTAGTNSSVFQLFMQLASRVRSRELLSFPLASAWKRYVVRHLGAPRCEDNVANPELGRLIDIFNQEVVPTVPDLRPISIEERRVQRVIATKARVYEFWNTESSKDLLDRLRLLRFGTRAQQEQNNTRGQRSDRLVPFLSEEQRSTVEWEESLNRFLHVMADWERISADVSLARFYEKCAILTGLIAIVPGSERKQALTHDLVRFLTTTEMRQMDPPVWKLQVDRAFHMTELSEPDLALARYEAMTAGDLLIRAILSLK